MDEMLVLVCGSRSFADSRVIAQELRRLPAGTAIIHGGASGTDMTAHAVAVEMGFSVTVYPADWKRYGKSAGPIRNREMLDREPDLVLAFWDGQSLGTRDTIVEAQRRGISLMVIDPRGDFQPDFHSPAPTEPSQSRLL